MHLQMGIGSNSNLKIFFIWTFLGNWFCYVGVTFYTDIIRCLSMVPNHINIFRYSSIFMDLVLLLISHHTSCVCVTFMWCFFMFISLPLSVFLVLRKVPLFFSSKIFCYFNKPALSYLATPAAYAANSLILSLICCFVFSPPFFIFSVFIVSGVYPEIHTVFYCTSSRFLFAV